MVRYNNERHIEMCFESMPIWQQHLSSSLSLNSLQILYVISLNSLWLLLKKKNEKAVLKILNIVWCVCLSAYSQFDF